MSFLKKIKTIGQEILFPLPFASGFSYRQLAYQATALTGFASLCAQTAWQKYLTILVGSESRSISLVVAVFLLGLSAGYIAFGKLTEKPRPRWLLLKIYGYVELATAFYISAFYLYFKWLEHLSFNSPNHFLMDVLVSVLALFLPTFLMGASIPVLTSTLPAKAEDVHSTHVKVYGWNTFGAFLGVLISGFYLLSHFGLAMTLIIAGGLNFLASLVFIGNKLKGDILRKESFKVIPSRAGNKFYFLFALVSGAVVISYEILFIRLLNLSAGAGVYNFPVILSLFVGGLALGGLSIKPQKISSNFFIKQILITVFLLAILYVLSPYWSIWLSHGKVSLKSLPSNYFVFKFFLYFFCALFLFPAVFFMGRLLPLTYSLLKKTSKNYGAVCGLLYFFNTFGTVLGAVVIGYLAFYLFNLNVLFKINLLALLTFGLAFSLYEKNKRMIFLSVILGLACVFAPSWNRTGHHLGYFRITHPSTAYFKKLFALPKNHGGEMVLFNDGPNATISLIGYKNQTLSDEAKSFYPPSQYDSFSFVVNGKAIGNSFGDFSTMFLLSSIGYLYAPERGEEGITSALVGLGMGISAGVMASLPKTKELTVLEIAPEVIQAVRKEPSLSFGLVGNPKAKLIAQDGFKYFTKTKKKFDVILSEPSNPWVVGVENVFSHEFYQLAKNTLAEDGVLVQWAQLYGIDRGTLLIMFDTLKQEFPFAKLYRIGQGDIAIVASPKPLKRRNFEERFFDPVLEKYHKALGFRKAEDLHLTQIFSEDVFKSIAQSNPHGLHTLTFPKLAYRADKEFFVGKSVVPENMSPEYLIESTETANKKIKAFKKYENLTETEITENCMKEQRFFCDILIRIHRNKKSFANKQLKPFQRFNSYIYLRRHGLLNSKPTFLAEVREELIQQVWDKKDFKKEEDIEKGLSKNPRALTAYLNQLLGEKQYEKVVQEIDFFKQKELIGEEAQKNLKEHLTKIREQLSSP